MAASTRASMVNKNTKQHELTEQLQRSLKHPRIVTLGRCESERPIRSLSIQA